MVCELLTPVRPAGRRRALAAVRGLLSFLLVAAITLGAASGARAAAAIATFPAPGGHVASPQTQIAFRGLSLGQLQGASISVSGSKSGAHSGRLAGDSDGRGGSFLPAAAFSPGETVTVKTSLNIAGAKNGTFQFVVAQPAGAIPFRPTSRTGRARGDVFTFHTDPALVPTRITMSRPAGPTAPGYLFLAPQAGPLQYGPEIIDQNGYLVWSQPAPAGDEVTNFAAQRYDGQPVLTWWQGNVDAGCGRGQDEILNSHYQPVATVQAANGLSADLHEFQITPSNTALITSYYPVYWNASSIHGPRNLIVLDGVVQEIDIKTGLVLFQWDSLDHVPLSASYAHLPPKNTRNPFDYFHVNSIDLDHDGNLLISARNTWAAYKVSHSSGAVLWTLGGKRSSFKFGPGASFAYQHDVRVRSSHDWFLTVFDDGGGPPRIHPSRGLKLFLDVRHKTVREVAQLVDSPPAVSNVEGNYEQLGDRHNFVGWGSGQSFSEFNPAGKLIFTGRFDDSANASYRAFRYSWSGSPTQPPAVGASTSGGHTDVYASWNGATAVSSWRVLGGSASTALSTVATASRHGFETHIQLRSTPAYVAVQALGSHGQVLGQSAAMHPA